jgi:serine/threonine-protein kinase
MTQDDAVAARAMSLFDRYADLSEAERTPALAALEVTDPDVCAVLSAMLAADASAHAFVSPLEWIASRGGDDAASRTDGAAIWRSGVRLGPWRIDGVLGIGGMGVVYAGERADGWYEREVAIKTIRPELVSPGVMQAFDRELSHLARLDHPAIVAVLDAGLAEDGQSWLAMQRVHGEPVDAWCDARDADLHTRVTLMIETCDAVRHAHAHGVLHQDIKPSNLLVADDGRVRLLDFGLSAMLAPPDGRTGPRIGVSMAYAAPEVLRGAAPSVAIDVHALGVMLYRLLCDDWPRHPPPTSAWLPVALPDGLPAPRAPSTLVHGDAVAQRRGLRDARALARQLRGDLDAIALRCVHDDPAQRYADVGALQADLQAWLAQRPVAARGDGWGYRAGRFVRRHALATGVFALCALAAAIGGLALVHQQQRAAEEARDAEVLGHLFERSLGVAMLSSLGNTPLASRTLLADTERSLRIEAGAERPHLLARGLTALARASMTAGDYAKADHLAGEAKALAVDDDLQAARTDAVLAQLANLRARFADAEHLVREGLDDLPAGADAAALVRLDLRMQLAMARWGRGDTRQAFAILDEAVATASRMGPDGAPALAELLAQRGYDRMQLFQLKQAEADLRRGLAVLGTRSPAVANALRRHLANTLLLSGERKEADREAAQSLHDSLRIFGPEHPETGRAWLIYGKTRFFVEDKAAAVEAIDRATAIIGSQIGRDHPDLAEALVIRSATAFEEGRLQDAITDTRRSLSLLERAYGPGHEATLKRRTDLASLLIFSADNGTASHPDATYREAASLLSDALVVGERQGLPMGYARDEYANVLLHLGRVDEADVQARLGISEVRAQFGPDTTYAAPDLMALMKVFTRQGHYDACDALGEWLLDKAAAETASHYSRFLVLATRLENAVARGDPARIRAAYREAEALARAQGFLPALEAIDVPETLRRD